MNPTTLITVARIAAPYLRHAAISVAQHLAIGATINALTVSVMRAALDGKKKGARKRAQLFVIDVKDSVIHLIIHSPIELIGIGIWGAGKGMGAPHIRHIGDGVYFAAVSAKVMALLVRIWKKEDVDIFATNFTFTQLSKDFDGITVEPAAKPEVPAPVKIDIVADYIAVAKREAQLQQDMRALQRLATARPGQDTTEDAEATYMHGVQPGDATLIAALGEVSIEIDEAQDRMRLLAKDPKVARAIRRGKAPKLDAVIIDARSEFRARSASVSGTDAA